MKGEVLRESETDSGPTVVFQLTVPRCFLLSQHITADQRRADIDTTLALRIDVGPTLARHSLMAGSVAVFSLCVTGPYLAFVMSLFVSYLFVIWCVQKAEFRDSVISWVSSHYENEPIHIY